MLLQPQLSALETSGLIRLAQTEPELEYLFRHALIQDAAYESLLKADRRVLHRAVAETLEKLYPEQRVELASTLGHHYSAAGEMERARQYFMLAGDEALSVYANREAEQHYRFVLKLTTSDSERQRLLTALGQALFRQNRYEEAITIWREGITLAQALGDNNSVARLYARSARAAGFPGQSTPRSLALCREGLAAVADGPETPGLASLLAEAGRACMFNGVVAEGRPLIERALEVAQRLGEKETQVEALITLGVWFEYTRQPHNNVAACTQAIEIAEAFGLWLSTARAHNNLGDCLIYSLGEFWTAHAHFQQAAVLCRRLGDTSNELFVLNQSARALLQLGELAAVEKMLPTQRRMLASIVYRDDSTRFGLINVEARLWRYQGELLKALQHLQAGQAVMRARSDRSSLNEAGNLVAEIGLELEQWEVAEGALLEVLEVFDPGFGEETLCLLVAVLARQGRLAEARRWLAETRTRLNLPLTPRDEERLTLAEARLAAAEEHWPEALAAFESAARQQAKMEMRWQHAQTLREWAEAHLARHAPGDVDHARELLREAQAEFEAMSVPKYATLAQERLQSLDP